ncbi:MAG TPA: alpha/beta hydrolase [Catenuloplanes sp.]|jgi:pimeloyl-ACP methyl ester carboxylesterase
MPLRFGILTTGVVTTLLVGAAASPAAPAAPSRSAAPGATAAAKPFHRTSPIEARRVDQVPTPELGWYKCFDYAECATVELPLDYDDPRGPSTELALLRVKARDQKKRIGSLFLNPGGPGALGTAIALAAPYFLGDEVLDRFDVVGVDPRGVGYSENLRCFRSVKDQTVSMAGFDVVFPYTRTQEKAYVASAKAMGRACSTTGRPLAGAMSTAEVARDMDVLRRAVGDRKLSFLGFSYGSALGQYYANMFPDRVRAVALDGIIDPLAWVGEPGTRDVIQDDRLHSADGAYRALREILVRCGRAGPELCPFAAAGDPVRNFDLVARRLRAKPLVIETPGSPPATISYADFIGYVLNSLYSPGGFADIAAIADELLTLTAPEGTRTAQLRAHAQRSAVRRITAAAPKAPGRDFPYNNGYESFAGVACTDGLHPRDAARWPKLTELSDRRAPYFGRAWGWGSAPCARDTWTVRDEDAYRGPFDRVTVAPVLMVGSFWDPATNYRDAVRSAALVPHSRLLSSDNWGHTAYGTSACVTGALDAYLVRGALPARGTVCTGDIQPFAPPPAERSSGASDRARRPTATMDELAAKGAPTEGAPKQLPPVAVRVPSSVGS